MQESLFGEPEKCGCSHASALHKDGVCTYPNCACTPALRTAARSTDPITSHMAAKAPFRRDSQRHTLLKMYGQYVDLTDEEAGDKAEAFMRCPWKRCSELREMNLIEPTGEMRESSVGALQRVCKITQYGREVLRLINNKA